MTPNIKAHKIRRSNLLYNLVRDVRNYPDRKFVVRKEKFMELHDCGDTPNYKTYMDNAFANGKEFFLYDDIGFLSGSAGLGYIDNDNHTHLFRVIVS